MGGSVKKVLPPIDFGEFAENKKTEVKAEDRKPKISAVRLDDSKGKGKSKSEEKGKGKGNDELRKIEDTKGKGKGKGKGEEKGKGKGKGKDEAEKKLVNEEMLKKKAEDAKKAEAALKEKMITWRKEINDVKEKM